MRWIDAKSKKPARDKYVLVTNGTDVWLGDWSGKSWGVVYNGAPPFEATDIKKWMLLPDPNRPSAVEAIEDAQRIFRRLIIEADKAFTDNTAD